MEQVHGTAVLELQAETPDGLVADVAVAHQAGLACVVMVADCLPVLFCTADGSSVAAAHAGWRGLLGSEGKGVIEAAYASLSGKGGEPARAVMAWLGPCIGPSAFEVGSEVRDAFLEAAAQSPEPASGPGAVAACFQPIAEKSGTSGFTGKWLADLPGLARLRMRALGVEQISGNDGTPDWCTVSNASRFFSHRRDRVSGRMAVCIWRNT